MSIHIDLLIPSFSVPLTSGNISSGLEPLHEHELKNLLYHCAEAFGVEGRDVEIFKMVNSKMDVRIGCFIDNPSM
jgi:hypothetical protein